MNIESLEASAVSTSTVFSRSLTLTQWIWFISIPLLLSASPPSEPVVARMEMKLAEGEKLVNVIEKGDLLTVLEEREEDYVILTHDGFKGAVDKVNAVRIIESGEIYSELIKEHPKEGRFYTLRASAWLALEKPDEALADFDKAIELGYEEAHAFSSRGLFHASRGDMEKAIADYNRAMEIDSDDVAPLVNRAAVFMNQGEFDQAIADYTKALEKEPDSISLHSQRAIAHKATGEFDEAISDYDAILDKHPENVAAIMGRGYIHFQQREHQQAVDDFAKAIELNPQDAVAYNNRGFNLYQLKKYAAAIKDYDEAIGIAPKYGLALQNRAWLLATAEDESLRDPKLAVESAKAACELSNYGNLSELSALAAALAANGQFAEAVGWQEKVAKMVAENYREFAEKTLERYRNEQPFTTSPNRSK